MITCCNTPKNQNKKPPEFHACMKIVAALPCRKSKGHDGRFVAILRLMNTVLKLPCLICKHFIAVQHHCLNFKQMAFI